MTLQNELNRPLSSMLEAVKDEQPTEAEQFQAQQRLKALLNERQSEARNLTPSQGSMASRWRKTTRSLKSLFSLPVITMTGVSLACFVAVFAFGLFGSIQAPAYASVVQKLNDMTSMVFRAHMKIGQQTTMKLTVHYLPEEKLRIETQPISAAQGALQPPMINIMDLSSGTGRLHMPQSVQPVAYQFDPAMKSDDVQENPLSVIALLKGYQGKVDVSGPEKINGVDAYRYQYTEAGQQVQLWADAKTEWPVRIELSSTQDSPLRFTFHADFTFNETLDASLFQGP